MNENTETDLKIESLTKSTLSNQVIDQIIDLLSSGKLKPGDKLPTEMELTEAFNVSRSVLREALSSLETLGMITRTNRKGTYINEKINSHPFLIMLSLSNNDIEALVEARMALELGIVTLAAEKIKDEQLKHLKDTINEIAKAEGEYYGHYDKLFHTIIAESVDNPMVESMAISLLIAHNEIDKKFVRRDKELTIQQHKDIYEALENRDPHSAYKAMYKHLKGIKDRLKY